MTTAAERARGIALWVTEGATQNEIVEALVKADLAAQRWAVAQAVMSRGDIPVIEATQNALLRGGQFDAQVPHDGTPPAP